MTTLEDVVWFNLERLSPPFDPDPEAEAFDRTEPGTLSTELAKLDTLCLLPPTIDPLIEFELESTSPPCAAFPRRFLLNELNALDKLE